MQLKNITEIEVTPARCIEVDADDRLFAVGGDNGDSIVTHNSVVQRNIIIGCLLRPDSWRFVGIDLKKVELSSFRAYKNVVLGIATTLEEAITILRFGQETMMKRYTDLEQLGCNNFLDLPEKGAALMIMVDEAGELLSPNGVKALSGSTPILTPQGYISLSELSIGDVIYDNNSQETVITKKYEPIEQNRFTVKIKQDSNNNTENVIAGSEHNWYCYIMDNENNIVESKIMSTEELYDFKLKQDALPYSDRKKIKFKRCGDPLRK